jgi:hypothetical protein
VVIVAINRREKALMLAADAARPVSLGRTPAAVP